MADLKKEKLKFYPTEKVVVLPFKRTLKGHRYAVTNHGRVIRFNKTPEDGFFAKPYKITAGYPGTYIQNGTKRYNALIHRLVAQSFLPKPRKEQVFVIHKDRDITNNHYTNLRWASKEEHVEHAKGSERWIKSYRSRSSKLSESKVRILKKRMKEGKTSYRHLAKQFGVTDMQLYRIKWGENWAWVK